MNQSDKDIEAASEYAALEYIVDDWDRGWKYGLEKGFLAGIQYERNRQSDGGIFGKWYSERIRLSENNPPGNHGAKMFGNEALLEAYEQGMKDAKEKV
jgi:hypothetical protein